MMIECIYFLSNICISLFIYSSAACHCSQECHFRGFDCFLIIGIESSASISRELIVSENI
jgi:hypothetical protein